MDLDLYRNLMDAVGRQGHVQQPHVHAAVILIDSSRSMKDFGRAPIEALMDFCTRLREDHETAHTLVSVAAFAHELTVLQPFAGMGHTELRDYRPEESGGTCLDASIERVMSWMLEKQRCIERQFRATFQQELALSVTFVVISDGVNYPPDGMPDPVELESLLITRAQRAIKLGWNLQLIGIGKDAQTIARRIGFPDDPDHAMTLKADPASFHRSMAHVENAVRRSCVRFRQTG